MLTFLQFITEAEHSSCPYTEWGLIHPKTGRLISGNAHKDATIHPDLKRKLAHKFKGMNMNDFPEYAHNQDPPNRYNHFQGDNYLLVRGIHKKNAHAVLKAWEKLPHAESGKAYLEGHKLYHDGPEVRGRQMLHTYAHDPKATFVRQ